MGVDITAIRRDRDAPDLSQAGMPIRIAVQQAELRNVSQASQQLNEVEYDFSTAMIPYSIPHTLDRRPRTYKVTSVRLTAAPATAPTIYHQDADTPNWSDKVITLRATVAGIYKIEVS